MPQPSRITPTLARRNADAAQPALVQLALPRPAPAPANAQCLVMPNAVASGEANAARRTLLLAAALTQDARRALAKTISQSAGKSSTPDSAAAPTQHLAWNRSPISRALEQWTPKARTNRVRSKAGRLRIGPAAVLNASVHAAGKPVVLRPEPKAVLTTKAKAVLKIEPKAVLKIEPKAVLKTDPKAATSHEAKAAIAVATKAATSVPAIANPKRAKSPAPPALKVVPTTVKTPNQKTGPIAGKLSNRVNANSAHQRPPVKHANPARLSKHALNNHAPNKPIAAMTVATTATAAARAASPTTSQRSCNVRSAQPKLPLNSKSYS